MKTLVLASILVLLSSASTPSFASTGTEILEGCSMGGKSGDGPFVPQVDEAFSVGVCMGNIEAIRFTLDTIDSLQTTLGTCIPNEVTNGQIRRVIVKFLKENPEMLHEHGTFLILLALQKAFPCSRQF